MKVTIQLVDDAGNLFAGDAVLERVSGNGQTSIHVESKSNHRISKTGRKALFETERIDGVVEFSARTYSNSIQRKGRQELEICSPALGIHHVRRKQEAQGTGDKPLFTK